MTRFRCHFTSNRLVHVTRKTPRVESGDPTAISTHRASDAINDPSRGVGQDHHFVNRQAPRGGRLHLRLHRGRDPSSREGPPWEGHLVPRSQGFAGPRQGWRTQRLGVRTAHRWLCSLLRHACRLMVQRMTVRASQYAELQVQHGGRRHGTLWWLRLCHAPGDAMRP